MTNTETNTDETLNENENEHETLGLDTTLEAVWRPSPNYQPRRDGRKPNILLLHYTAMEKPEWAIERLCDEETGVSCHYLVAEDGAITQMVSESKRAWHAGHSYWAGETDINSASIGIEIANPCHELGYPDFPEAQMQAVEALCKDILSRHDIPPSHVLGHSDVAPRRKKDPGEKFDWARLYRAGIGHWVEPEPIGDDIGLRQGDKGDEVRHVQLAVESLDDQLTRPPRCASDLHRDAQARHFAAEGTVSHWRSALSGHDGLHRSQRLRLTGSVAPA